MTQAFIHFFSSFPPVLATIIMSALPLVERVALPVAIVAYRLPVWEAMILIIAGNMIPITAILLVADKFHKWVSQNSGFFGKAWLKALAHAQKKFARYQKYELIGLLIFMAIPLPVNGGYTASLIAFILGLPFKKSWPYLFVGTVIANLVIAVLTVGLDKIF
ncbi:ligand-binding protein SH3 [Patescibacteria group bacterium]|nr:MAG: ligand-binding protein SH3 [Patescibacteria group bacterium]